MAPSYSGISFCALTVIALSIHAKIGRIFFMV
jgi:hypothetical protein